MNPERIEQIEKELRDYEAEIYETSAEYRQLALEAAEKRAVYDLDWAKEMLKISTGEGKLTVAEKEAMCLTAVEKQFVACRITEAMADACKRRLTALQANLTSVQTRASLFKTERAVMGMAT